MKSIPNGADDVGFRGSEPVSRSSGDSRPLILGLLLALITAAVYWPVRHHDFINLDDGKYVTSNPHVQAGLTLEGVSWALTTTRAGNWHPVTWLSHMLDCQLYGLNPGGHHLTNLLLHIANTLLLFMLLRRMTGALWRSAMVAALFALHPLHVESVAWVAERKDVLSTFFFMLTLWAYVRYVSGVRCQVSRPGRSFRSHYYWLALLFFSLGLMSKPMLVTAPFILVLLDYWPLKRFELSRSDFQLSTFWHLLLEKMPFFGLSIASCAVTFLAQNKTGAVVPLTAIPVTGRVGNAVISYVRYLWKMIWPTDLAIYYPFSKGWPVWEVAAAALGLIAITAGMMAARCRARYGLFGWLWYLGTLVPVIGLVQVGGQAMADRYTYIPSIGVFVAVVWGLSRLVAATPLGRVALGTLGVLVVTTFGWATRKQLEYWHDSAKLFQHALAVATPSARAHALLAQALLARNELEEAKVHFEAAVKLAPRDAGTLANLGTVYGREGKLDEAIRCFREAAKYDPNDPATQCNWGYALNQKGQAVEAITHYREAIRRKPDYAEALNGLAWLLATSRDAKVRDGAEAVRLAKRAKEVNSGTDAGSLDTLAAAYAEAGQFSNAVVTAKLAVRLAESKQQAEEFRARLRLYEGRHPYHER